MYWFCETLTVTLDILLLLLLLLLYYANELMCIIYDLFTEDHGASSAFRQTTACNEGPILCN